MTRVVLIFIVALITSFFLVAVIDYVYHPVPTSQWVEEINPPPVFDDPWLPLCIVVVGVSIIGALYLMFCPCITRGLNSCSKKNE